MEGGSDSQFAWEMDLTLRTQRGPRLHCELAQGLEEYLHIYINIRIIAYSIYQARRIGSTDIDYY